MARLLQLNATQEGVLNIVFKGRRRAATAAARLHDLQSVLQWTAEECRLAHHALRQCQASRPSASSNGHPLTLEQQGGERFFGEPALDLAT